MTTNEGRTADISEAPISLIPFLWPRIQKTYDDLRDARVDGDPGRIAELLIQFRTTSLLMASEPAQSWAEVEPKVLTQALLRHDAEVHNSPGQAIVADMCEIAIMADHQALNRALCPRDGLSITSSSR